ncbi:uncharacterized protein LOC111384618 [Olea europaea var. sylvestris]|uniref:uncharacterized protein LOC111384618 n=1 Tax=Olea europaea var. sylvestris TaxID=158386 RepID=UPI000C1D8D30|nr:uncharacterized protein LOC111384618 [Olea europaea var. sylvestris]
MRIRKRFAPSYFSSEPLADLHLNQSLSNGNQAKPESDQPSNPPQQPSDQNMVIIKWALHPNAAITGKRKEMESGEDEEKPSSDDIRNARILVQEVDIKFLQPSSSSDPADGRWREEDKIVPLKKRKGTLNRCASNETLTKARMKSKTNKKCVQEKADHDGNYCPNKKRANVILEGSRCSRVNGRGWRCCQPTLLVHASRHTKALPYGMLLTKIFKHFNVSLDGEDFIKLRPIDTIYIQTLKRMKIVKEHGQWVAHTKGFDPTSGPSTLLFEDEAESDEEVPEVPAPASDILGSSVPPPSRECSTFTEEHYNLFHGWIDSLTSLVDGMGSLLFQMQAQQISIQDRQFEMQHQQLEIQQR